MKETRALDILLIEDNDDDILLTEEAFAENRLTNKLVVARTGADALKYLNKEGIYADAKKPGVILLDLNLPGISGIEVLQQIKNDEYLKDIPVVVLTTSSLEEDIITSYKLHANCYINKPVSLDRFLEVIKIFGDFWLSVATLPENNE